MRLGRWRARGLAAHVWVGCVCGLVVACKLANSQGLNVLRLMQPVCSRSACLRLPVICKAAGSQFCNVLRLMQAVCSWFARLR